MKLLKEEVSSNVMSLRKWKDKVKPEFQVLIQFYFAPWSYCVPQSTTKAKTQFPKLLGYVQSYNKTSKFSLKV